MLTGANFYIQLVNHEERTFGWKRLLQWPPWRALQGNYSQREIQQQIRQRLRQFSDLRIAIRNPQTFVGGGGGNRAAPLGRKAGNAPEFKPLAQVTPGIRASG